MRETRLRLHPTRPAAYNPFVTALPASRFQRATCIVFATALAWAASVAGAPRPTLPDLPLGTASSAFAGGGAGRAGGIGSVFDNPGALSIRDGFQAEAGLMGLAAGLSPYFLYGSQAPGDASYALGYWYDARPGDPDDPHPPRQGLIAGVSWEPLHFASLGGAIRSAGTGAGVGRDGFGIDADIGSMIRAWRSSWLGLAMRNLMESGVGQVPAGFRTHRSYVVSLGTGLSGMRLAGLAFHDPDAYYELRAHGLPPYGRVTHAFSLGSAFMPGGRLGLRGTFVMPHGGTPGMAAGLFLNMPTGRGAVQAAYTFHSGGSAETGEALASHSISLNLRLGGRMDPLPPAVEVSADKVRLAPADSATDVPAIHFHLSARDMTYVPGRGHGEEADEPAGSKLWAGRRASLDENRSLAEGRIKSWALIVRAVGEGGLAGKEIKSYRGRDLPPRVIRWEAVDESGRPLPAGFYAFRLEAADLADNEAATSWQVLEIAAPSVPAEALGAGE